MNARLLGPLLAATLIVVGLAMIYTVVSPNAPGAGQAAEPLDEVVEWCEEALNFTPLCEHAYQWCCEQYAAHHGVNLTCVVERRAPPPWPARLWELLVLGLGVSAVFAGVGFFATAFREYRSRSG